MRKTAIALTICLTALLMMQCTQGSKKVRLRYKYQPGNVYTFEQTTKRAIKVYEADSLTKDISTSVDVLIKQTITNVKDGVAELAEQAIWIYEMPSEKDTSVMETKQDTSMMVFRVRSNGQIVGIDFGEDSDIRRTTYIRNYYEQGMPVFPERDLSLGESWTQTTRIVLPDETLEASTTYRLKSLVREAGYDCAVIEYDGNMVIPIEASPEDSTQRTGLDRIDATGMISFAYKEGMVVLQRERWVIEGSREKLVNGKKIRYRLTVEADTEFTLTKAIRN